MGSPDFFFVKYKENDLMLPFLEWTSLLNIEGMPLFLFFSCLAAFWFIFCVLKLIFRFISNTATKHEKTKKHQLILNVYLRSETLLVFTLWLIQSNIFLLHVIIRPKWKWKNQYFSSVYSVISFFIVFFILLTLKTGLIEIFNFRFLHRVLDERITKLNDFNSILNILVPSFFKKPTFETISEHKGERKKQKKKAKAIKNAFRELNRVFLNTDSLGDDSKIPSNSEDVEEITKKIFEITESTLHVSDFLSFFQTKEDASLAFIAFDKDENGDVSREEMHSVLEEYTLERKDILTSMNVMKSAVHSLDYLLSSVVVIIGGIILVFSIEESVSKVLTTVFTALFIPLAFIFGNTMKELFELVIIVFFKGYFDVGDTICINGANIYMVKAISIMTSEMETMDGRRVYYPNINLKTSTVDNFRRSGNMSESIKIEIDIDTNDEKIQLFEEKMLNYIERNTKQLRGPFVFRIQELDLACKKMKCEVSINYKFNLHNYRRSRQIRNEFVSTMKNVLSELQITCPLIKLI